MLVFTNDQKELNTLSEKYKKSGEISSVSLPIEFEGRKYRAIVYRQTLLGKPKKDINGIVFVNENNEAEGNQRVIKELLGLLYYMELLLDDKSIEAFNKAIAPDMEIQKEKRDYGEIIDMFQELKDAGVTNLENLRGLFIKLPQLKEENNLIIKKYIDAVNSIQAEDFVYNKEIQDKLMPLYRDVLLKNIQRVKYVNSGRYYYDDIKEKAGKLRGRYKWRLINRGGIEPLNKLDQTISYFKRMLKVYEQILNLNDAQYLKYIKNTENHNIESRLELIRK